VIEVVNEEILKELKQKFSELHEKSKDYETHDELKTALIEKNILNLLGYKKRFHTVMENYVKPLRARYGVLTDGAKFILYE